MGWLTGHREKNKKKTIGWDNSVKSYDKRTIIVCTWSCHQSSNLHAFDEILYHPKALPLLVVDGKSWQPLVTILHQMLSGMSSAPIDCIQETAIAVTHLALPDVPSGLQKSINDLQPWMEKYFWGRHFPSFAGFHKSGEGRTKYPTWQSLVPFYHSEGGFPLRMGPLG